MTHLKDLKKLGLTPTEIKVYIATLEMDGGYVSTIAQKADVERTNCYHTLKTLNKKGLISITNRGNLQYYLPESPKKILIEQEDKLFIAQKLVPQLLNLQSSSPSLAPKMKYYEGKEAVQNLFMQSLESKTEILSYTHVQKLKEKFEDLLHDYCDKQSQRQQKIRRISPFDSESQNFIYEYYPQEYIDSYVQLLYINPKEFSMENDVCIYDDRVAIISLHKGEHIGVIIESQVYADTSRTIFNLSWLGATSFIAQ